MRSSRATAWWKFLSAVRRLTCRPPRRAGWPRSEHCPTIGCKRGKCWGCWKWRIKGLRLESLDVLSSRMGTMIDHDQRFKNLLHEFLPEFFQLFFPSWAERFDFAQIEWLDKEAFPDPPQGERRSLDLVAK